MPTSTPRPARAASPRPLLAALLVLLACSSDGGSPVEPGPPDPDPPPPGDPGALLECDRVGYPCGPSGVPGEVLLRSQLLADSAVALLQAGTSADQVREWLAARQGVVSVQGDAHALRFRVAGGMPWWVFDDGIALSGEGGAPDHPLPPPAHRAVAGAAGKAGKRALVLSPFAWQFGVFDEGPGVAAILAATRGYDGGVQHLATASQGAPPIPLSIYTTWGSYEVVHVSTHGATVCDGSGCRATMSVAIDNREMEEVAATWSGPGVTFSVGSETGHRYVNLEADFFLRHYPGGVGNTLVFLSACETLQGSTTDLADAIRGELGVFLGWSAPVASGPAGQAALSFHLRLSEDGVTAGRAYDDLGDQTSSTWIDDQGHAVTAFLRMTTRKAGGDLRVREIAWLENPAGGAPLEGEERIRIRGTLGDGLPDSVPWRVRVDGVDAPAGGFTVRVEVGNVPAPPVTLAGADSTGSEERVLTGVLAMGRDLSPDETVPIRVRVELPDGGISTDTATVGFLDDPGYWVGRAVHVRETDDTSEVIEAEDLRFEYNPDLDRYELASGTLFWSDEGQTFDARGQVCSYALPPTPVTPAPGSAFLQIHSGSDPARYTVYGSYEGLPFSIPTSCPGFQKPMKFHAVWLRSSGVSAEVVSEDGNRINGFLIQDWGFLWEGWAWELERRTGEP
jgi:hypothetical protein